MSLLVLMAGLSLMISNGRFARQLLDAEQRYGTKRQKQQAGDASAHLKARISTLAVASLFVIFGLVGLLRDLD